MVPAAPVELAGRQVSRLGVSLAELKVTGMWGEPVGRTAGVATIRRAVELGAGVLEVPVPFGPAADLLREAGTGVTFIVARLTGPVADARVLEARLGRRPDLIVADADRLGSMAGWGIPLGVLVGPDATTVDVGRVAAVRGPSPAPPGLVERCERGAIPYLGPDPGLLAAGRRTVAVPAVTSVGDVERVLGGG